MDFKSWLDQTKTDDPDLESFITKIEPFFTENGFKGSVFERKVTAGLNKIDTDIDKLEKPVPDAEN